MERYHGNSGLAVLCGFFGVAMLALAIWVTSQAATQLGGANLLGLAAGIFVLLSLLGTSLLILVATRDLGSSFLVDDRGITRRLLGRATTIAWSDLDRFEELFSTESDAQGRFKLYAADGRRMIIPISCLTDGDRLRARLEEYLAPLRARALREIAKSGRSLRPDRTVGLVVLGFIAPMVVLAGLSCYELARSGRVEVSPTYVLVVGALGAVAGPALVMLGAELVSRVLTVSDSGIALRSLFLDRKISFKRVESVTLRLERGDEPRGERAKIQGDGQSIAISSGMTGYREIMEHVRSRCGVEPVRAGEVAKPNDGSPRGLLGWTTDVLGPLFMSGGFVLMLTGGWRLFSAGTAADDGPTLTKMYIGAALLLVAIALAIVSHQIRSSGKTRDPEL